MRKASHLQKGRNGDSASAPIVSIKRSELRPITRLLLAIRAGGRCEFDGCNRDLTEHHVTLTEGNFAEVAHIVAFKPEGPRGKDALRPRDVNDVANLMLLCPACHKLVDDHPGDYSRTTLEEYKRRHEERIRHVTGLGPGQRTTVLVLKAQIGEQTVAIPFGHILEAVAPRYPISRPGVLLDLTLVAGNGAGFMDVARTTIDQRLSRLYEPQGEASQSGHVSVFALAPIPLLVFLGTKLSNKVPVDIFQRHRDTESWAWKTDGTPLEYEFRQLRRGSTKENVALAVSLSGTIALVDLPAEIDSGFSVYELRPMGITPNPTLLRLRADLENFRVAYQEAIGTIIRDHGLIPAIHLFPAVPAPVAVLCGRELLPKVHPALAVYDYDKQKGGFRFQLKVNDYEHQ
jgi:hypothetical protein